MAKSGVDQLMDKWLNEPGFRDKMKRDPEGTVKACGITLSAEEWATVRNVMKTTQDERLTARASKGLKLGNSGETMAASGFE